MKQLKLISMTICLSACVNTPQITVAPENKLDNKNETIVNVGNKIPLAPLPANSSQPSNNIKVIEIRNLPSEIDLRDGEQILLSPEVLMSNGEVNRKVGFLSSNTLIITVSQEGILQRKAPGEATVTVYALEDYNTTKKIKIFFKQDSIPAILPSGIPSIQPTGAPQPQVTPFIPSIEMPESSPFSPAPTPSPISTPSPIPTPTLTPSPDPTPLAPNNLTTSDITTKRFALSWDPVSDANSYSIYLNGDLIANGVTTPPFYREGLEPDTNYTLQMKTVNNSGASEFSQSHIVRTLSLYSTKMSSTTQGSTSGYPEHFLKMSVVIDKTQAIFTISNKNGGPVSSCFTSMSFQTVAGPNHGSQEEYRIGSSNREGSYVTYTINLDNFASGTSYYAIGNGCTGGSDLNYWVGGIKINKN